MLRASALYAMLFTCTAGCSNGGSMMPPPTDMARGPMDHPPLWHIRYGGGPTQPAPEVYTVVWQGSEALGARLADFTDWMLKSDYWKNSLAEYGITAGGKSKGLIVLPMAAPALISDSGIQDLSKMLVSTGQVSNNSNTQLAFAPPLTTSVNFGGDLSCEVFVGYHGHVNIGTARASRASRSTSSRAP